MGPHHIRKTGSNSNSSRTSPSKVDDVEFVNSLLAQANRDDEGLCLFLTFEPILILFCTRFIHVLLSGVLNLYALH